jgi:hypothetical protein
MLAISCESVPAGPTLSNVSFTPAIETSAGWRASQLPTVRLGNGALDPTVCCCHIRGTLRNANSVPVHVIITFAAQNPLNQQVQDARVVYFASDLQAGASANIEVPGLLFACVDIDHVTYQLNVSSVGVPLL